MIATIERLALAFGAPVFAFHTASFMTRAIVLYERLGYRRVPEFDFDMAARYSGPGAAPIMSLAYLRCLNPVQASVEGARHDHDSAASAYIEKRNH